MGTAIPAAALRVMVLEPDAALRRCASEALAALGARGVVAPPAEDSLDQLAEVQPDVLLLDGGMDPSGLIASLRRREDLAAIRIVVLLGEDTPERRMEAYAAGADECAAKYYNAKQLGEVLSAAGRFILTFWGVRGSFPVPGSGTLRYGGNTSCVSVAIGRDRQLVFDAGTGIKSFSDRLCFAAAGRFSGHILISHPHWDHLIGLPFFAPLYLKGNRIALCGPPQQCRSLRALIASQMDGVFFPITADEFEADVLYRDLDEGQYRFDGISVRATRLQHPGLCLAYRVDYGGRSVAYVTDNELAEENGTRSDGFCRLARFLRGVDVLIHDTTYFDDEYRTKVKWGHSSIAQVTDLAHESGVKDFYLFHHAPEHDDDAVDRKLRAARQQLAALGSRARCHIAAEGMEVDLRRL